MPAQQQGPTSSKLNVERRIGQESQGLEPAEPFEDRRAQLCPRVSRRRDEDLIGQFSDPADCCAAVVCRLRWWVAQPDGEGGGPQHRGRRRISFLT